MEQSKKQTFFLVALVAILALLAGSGSALYRSGKIFKSISRTATPMAAVSAEVPLEKVSLRIEGTGDMEGMICEGCAERVRSALLGVSGVHRAQVSLEDNLAEVECEKGKVTIHQLVEAVKEVDFKAIPRDEPSP